MSNHLTSINERGEKMSDFIFIILIVGILYVAFTYLKVPKKSNTDSDIFTTHPFSSAGMPPEMDEAGLDARPDAEPDTEQDTEPDTEQDAGLDTEPDTEPVTDTAATPDDAEHTTPDNQGVVIDSEVHVDAPKPSDMD